MSKILTFLFVFIGFSLVAQTSIYWGNTGDGTIKSSDLDGTNVQTLTSISTFPEDVVYNPLNDSLYFVDGSSAATIFRMATDGSGLVNLISGLSSPDGMELDLAAGKMYYAESTPQTISKANLDGSNIEVVVTGTGLLEGIALDIANQKIYWAVTGASQINSADFDGSNVTNVFTGTNGTLKLAKDMSSGFIYFTEFSGNNLSRINPDGTGYTVITSGLNTPGGVVLDADSGKIFFNDRNGIYSINLDGTGLTTLVSESGLKLTIELNNNRSLPPSAGVPTLGQWGIITLSLLVLIFGIVGIRQKALRQVSI
ncbi:IPTL-CTERM sorting domain-containing protein [Portibacter lacus]|nr:IPTL-CTERM sorting domain-containing protein [Portibacter lacus]